ncbi:MAG TPA: DUF3488 and transglutaminase-like domain-containing protein [Jatrophihabitans sp.]|nr:DUF3488 and transglutaminase-like domain-containing protein [Jatrophihabitans sp.]
MSRPARPQSTLLAATATVAGGMLLTTLPLSSVFTDWAWLWVSLGCALPYLLVVGAFRYWGSAAWWHSVIGLAAAALVLLWVFVPQHLLFGVLPTPSSGSDISHLITQARQVMQDDHAPLPSSPPTRLLVAAALVALVALTDVLGVLLRQPLLAAAPLLEVLAVASATSSRAANPVWFAAAAVGFLLILLAGTRLQDGAWGPSVDGTAGRLGGGRRMAVTGIVAALIVPLLLPAVPTNLLARAAHHNADTAGDGNGSGQLVLNSLASLKGSLRRPTPTNLFQVQVGTTDQPFYVRQEVDDEFTNDGWRPSGTDLGALSLSQGQFPIAPGSGQSSAQAFQIEAAFTILNLGGATLPILANPSKLRLSSSGGDWNAATANVSGVKLKRNMVYVEQVQQLQPSAAQLRSAPAWDSHGDAAAEKRYRSLPQQPAEVVQLAAKLTAGLSTSYDKALAISDYFTNGRNGFTYSLDAPADDGRNALVNFLEQKHGFCQQYAAAAAVLMREAGLPARVVVGYTHHAPGTNGVFVVTSADAHAWVEVFFPGIGWIPFDPTPLAGADAARVVPLQWATHPNAAAQSSDVPNSDVNRPSSAGNNAGSASPSTVVAAPTGGGIPPLAWQLGGALLAVVLLVLLVLFGPRWVRGRQRRRRLDRARATGNPELLWLELAASAADRNALWPRTLTVGQVPEWLGRHGVDERGRTALQSVAQAVERDRFSARPVATVAAEDVRALDQALLRWGRRTDRRLSLLNRWLPKSMFGRGPTWQR